jgi:hypothetical protein
MKYGGIAVRLVYNIPQPYQTCLLHYNYSLIIYTSQLCEH